MFYLACPIFNYCLLPTAYCLLPTAYCLLPTAYCLLPTAYWLLPHQIHLPPAFCKILIGFGFAFFDVVAI